MSTKKSDLQKSKQYQITVVLQNQICDCQLVIFFSFSFFLLKVKVTQLCLTFATSWTVAHQAHLSVEFSRQEYWSGLPFPTLCCEVLSSEFKIFNKYRIIYIFTLVSGLLCFQVVCSFHLTGLFLLGYNYFKSGKEGLPWQSSD